MSAVVIAVVGVQVWTKGSKQGLLSVPGKQCRKRLAFFFHTFNSLTDGRIHLIPAAHAFKGFFALYADELFKIILHGLVVQHICSENFHQSVMT